MRILVTGGAGYVGSVTVKYLQESGFEVVVFDNLENGHRNAVNCPLVVGDLRNKEDVKKLFEKESFDAVFHFAAYVDISVSMKQPEKYFRNNYVATLNLLEEMAKASVNKLIYSSTSEVYGSSEYLPFDEEHPLNPDNPYGESKLQSEKTILWYHKLKDLRFISLRYFNAAGAPPEGDIGEDHRPELHLIPNAIRGALGLCEFEFTYPEVETSDGSPIRDYVHVSDIAQAHILALPALADKEKNGFYNVGTGKGYSTKEVVRMVKEITGVDFPTQRGEARPGEPPAKYASNEKVRKELGWQMKYSLKEIIETAYKWHKSHPDGYEK